jgi:hypothetical protein
MNTVRAWLRAFAFSSGVFLFLALTAGLRAAETTTNRFHPLSLEGFYQRPLASYRPTEALGAVPRGLVEFTGVPFRMVGKLEMNGLGPSRDGNFLPTRVGPIPVGRRLARLHLISGTGYKDPDGTPLAVVRLNYTNGETRQFFLSYGVHVRNWHVESDEQSTELSDPNSSIPWEGINGATGRPLRLFQNAFDNPLPAQPVRSLELFSLFGKAFPMFLAMTAEDADPKNPRPPVTTPDPDDAPYRRELLVRVRDELTGKTVTNATLEVTVKEREREFRFGRYLTDRFGEIILDYPPKKFDGLSFRLGASGYLPQTTRLPSEDGHFPGELPLSLIPQGTEAVEPFGKP